MDIIGLNTAADKDPQTSLKHMDLLLIFAIVVIRSSCGCDIDCKREKVDSVPVGKATFLPDTRQLRIETPMGNRFEAYLGRQIKDSSNFNTQITTEKKVLLNWGTEASVTIDYSEDEDVGCYTIFWDIETTHFSNSNPTDCIPITTGHWYGGPEVRRQEWPIKGNVSLFMQPYVSKDIPNERNAASYGSYVERYFLNSKGVAIVVDDQTPLWLSINENNDGKICFMAKYTDYEFPSRGKRTVPLKYDICVGNNVKDIHTYVMEKYYSKPDGIPDERMFQHPIWSTWAKFKHQIDQKSVMDFARSIINHGFSNSQLEIDDMWPTSYGDVTFDARKFPNPKEMINALHTMGFRVTLWTHPFANTESKTLQQELRYRWVEEGALSVDKGAKLVKNTHGVPALVQWWNGFGGLIDFTNPSAAEWFLGRHHQIIEEFGVDSFKFDAGEAEFVPTALGTYSQVDSTNQFSSYYAKSVSNFGRMVEVRSGYRVQNLPIFVRMMDKFSTWSQSNGLRSLIPTCLTLGITGYPFVLPDMIGGNVYFGKPIPDKELFIRWLEITAFMPAMQFSVVPWQYDDEVVEIARKYAKLHSEYLTPIILRYARLSTVTDGLPIIRPIWWISPRDEVAFSIDDEFLIGDEILVGPVVHEGARNRNVYLPGPPEWKWHDNRTGEIHDSGIWLMDYPVALDEVAFFTASETYPQHMG